MYNLLLVSTMILALIYLLFAYKRAPFKTLSAARWMILTWSSLLLINIFSPVNFTILTLSLATVLYCTIWVITFCVGDKLGFNLYATSKSSLKLNIPISKKPLLILLCCAIIGMVGLIYTNINNLDFTSLLANLRTSEIAGEQSGLLKTVSTFLACVGIIVFLINIIEAIFNNKKLSKLSLLGLMSYFSVTLFTAGRSGVIFALISMFIVITSTLQLSSYNNKKVKSILLNLIIISAFGISYIMYVVSTRTTGWIGSMDNKISYINVLLQSSLNESFRESLRPFGAFGDMIIESFYYLAPQFYGLEHSINYYDGSYGFGAVQFPYLTRRIENLFNIDILNPIYVADKATYENWGVAANFFRTAVHTTFIDFGIWVSLLFVFICGIFAGRTRKISLMSKSPFYIALQGMICAGSAWTIIFSPFVEQSWAFPILWFIVIILFTYVIKPILVIASTSQLDNNN